ncbi:MAG: hypothetical protein IPJ20_22820 [Flammeovirgaceae bacterium]|jgi:hypothetical protein|nr:hypothetical protein [Flammeovirgaceae bacterium]
MKVIVYDNIEKKNLPDEVDYKALTSKDALIQTLDLMDFYAKLNSVKKSFDDTTPWIILQMTNKQNYANQ